MQTSYKYLPKVRKNSRVSISAVEQSDDGVVEDSEHHELTSAAAAKALAV